MAQLPVVVKRDIRDRFDSPKAQLQQQFAGLKAAIGYPVKCKIDWPIVWTECESHFEDKSTFVPYVESQVLALCDALETKLEDESSPWTEQLLEKIAKYQTLELEVHATQDQQASVRFSNNRNFLLTVPWKPATLRTSSDQLLKSLDNAFTPAGSKPSLDDDDEWTGISTPSSSHPDIHPIMTPTTSTFSFPHRSAPPAQPTPLPSVSSLARPDILFNTSTPSLLHIYSSALSTPPRIIIQTTHEPTLRLIHDYFTKWTRSDPQTRERVPLLRYTLGMSCLGPGGGNDTLVVEPFSQISARSGSVLNVMLFVAFVQGVAGYEVVNRSGEGEYWELERRVPFG